MIALGIEGTAHTIGFGLYENGKILANVMKMLVPKKGGIHPREAAIHHADNFIPLLKEALTRAGISLNQVDLVSFSKGPGLGSCLRTVATGARVLALKLDKPIIGVNHCIAHLEIGKLMTGAEDPIMVYLSGGNTQIISFQNGRYRVFGETLDIGIGNMLDKLGREFKFSFPGGPKLEKLALSGSRFYNLPYSVKGMDVSFSGLLTAALAHFKKEASMEDLAYSVQEVAFSMITEVAERALAHLHKDEILLAGGVARNKRMQEMLKLMVEDRAAKFYVPHGELCIDNGAMIAYLGALMFEAGVKMTLLDTEVDQKFRTDLVDVVWNKDLKHFKNYETLPGAEAEILRSSFFGKESVQKVRMKKSYRNEELDLKLRKERLRKEARLITETKKLGLSTPWLYDIDMEKLMIEMQYLSGPTLRDVFDGLPDSDKGHIAREIGRYIAILHKHGIAHGDLTTSNIILSDEKLYFIDFSMGSKNAENEELGVDLHLMKEAFLSAHYENYQYFEKILDSYQSNFSRGKEIVKIMKEIEERRRYA